MLNCLLTVMLMASTGWGAGFVKRELWEGAATTTLNDAVLVAQGGSAPTTTTYIAQLDYVGNTIDGYVDKFTAWLVPRSPVIMYSISAVMMMPVCGLFRMPTTRPSSM
jgi:hypothetical protein